MIQYTTGNVLLADTDAVVNAVNTTGAVGKDIARAFKRTYPSNFAEYEAACKAGQVTLGKMLVTQSQALIGPRWIIHFPTSEGSRQTSRLPWIVAGLIDLRRVIEANAIESIAVPALGCGGGGLAWKEVKDALAEGLGDMPAVRITIYEPPDAGGMDKASSGKPG